VCSGFVSVRGLFGGGLATRGLTMGGAWKLVVLSRDGKKKQLPTTLPITLPVL